MNSKPYILIGLTGPIGAGKSVVASVWASHNAGIVEGDAMGKLALQVDPELRLKLAQRFGSAILDPKGDVIHSRLAEAAFRSVEHQRELTRLTFPALYRLAREHFAQMGRGHSVVVFDAAMLFEWGIEKDFDWIVAVTAPLERLIPRASQRLNISAEQAEIRFASQLPPAQKARRANRVIVNDKSVEELKRQAEQAWGDIKQLCLGEK